MSERTHRLSPQLPAPPPRRVSVTLALASVLGAGGCGNPVADARIEALGDENPNVAASEYHRPGQPCVLCHSAYPGDEPEISIGGTVFAYQDQRLPAAGVEVVLTDAEGERKTITTNCVGNFFFRADEWQPQYPVAAEIRYPDYDETGVVALDPATQEPLRKAQKMSSWISRDGSCASCHTLEGPGYASAGWVYCVGVGGDEATRPLFPPIAPDCPGEAPQ